MYGRARVRAQLNSFGMASIVMNTTCHNLLNGGSGERLSGVLRVVGHTAAQLRPDRQSARLYVSACRTKPGQRSSTTRSSITFGESLQILGRDGVRTVYETGWYMHCLVWGKRPLLPRRARSRACLQERGDRLVGDDDPALGSGYSHVVLGGRECLAQGRRAGRHRGDDGVEDVV